MSDVRQVETPEIEIAQNLGQPQGFRQVDPNRDEEEYISQHNHRPIIVQRNHDPDHVLRNVQRNSILRQNNIVTIVEAVMAQKGFNMGLHRPIFVSPFPMFIRQIDFPRRWKVPKFIKFSGETNESMVEHVVRYQSEVGDMANNKNLKMKYFPSSLTKNVFTCLRRYLQIPYTLGVNWKKSFMNNFTWVNQR